LLEGVIPLETFSLAEWHEEELADVPSFTVLKTQICVTRPQCVKHFTVLQLNSRIAGRLKLEIKCTIDHKMINMQELIITCPSN